MSQSKIGPETPPDRFDGDEPLTLSRVSHGFGDTDVLRDIDLTVRQGETLAVIGPSGTGKTTLLRLCALFHQPDRGTVRVGDTAVWDVSARDRLSARRRIGMVFQEAMLFDGSVAHTVEYGLRIRRPWPDRLRHWAASLVGERVPQAVTEALEAVGLADQADQDAASLSGGEAQRVAFARALAYDPDILLLDEPTSDLDPRNTAVLEHAIDAARGQGCGVVIATHDMHQARRLADRVAVLLDGRCIECGPTERVFTEPDDSRVRRFIDGELVY